MPDTPVINGPNKYVNGLFYEPDTATTLILNPGAARDSTNTNSSDSVDVYRLGFDDQLL